MSRLHYTVWGRGLALLDLPAYAVQADGEGEAEAVYRSIARRNRLHVCGGPRSEGKSLMDGARHFAATLGKRCPGGGYTPIAEVWIAIEVSR